MYTIKYYKSPDEARACEAYLLWQGKTSIVTEDPVSLRDSRGHMKPVIYDEKGKIYAIGFHDLYKKVMPYC
jgi:hypothetical protein